MLSRLVGSFKTKLGTSAPVRRHRNPNLDDDIVDENDTNLSSSEESLNPSRHIYSRPNFLQLISEEETEGSNHQTRPIITPKNNSRIPLGAGYAECINGGKSIQNEDLAAVGNFILPSPSNSFIDGTRKIDTTDVQYFAIFDGHAGPDAALMAADQLINHLQEKFVHIQDDLFVQRTRESYTSSKDSGSTQLITVDCLVRGALEAAFVSFDEHIAKERNLFTINGGCAAIVAVVLLDRVYVAHAGDCRGMVYIGQEMIELASEFTPETDAERIQYLAHIRPELTHHMFSENCFLKPLNRKDIGSQVLYRGPQRAGWHYKEVTEEDVYRSPLVSGQGKWARLMGMIGVTRGFGDHGLVVPNTQVHVKPFMSAVPEVRVLNLAGKKVTEDDVLVMGSDGLWDMLRNEQIESAVRASFVRSKEDKNVDRYTKAAEDLVHLARGDNKGKGWKMKDGRDASFDDISAFVIPLHRCLSSTLKKSS